jgi:hypothetical protein
MAGTSEFPRGSAETDEGTPTDREPMFRYMLPSTLVATAAVDIGHVGVKIELLGDGELAVTADRRHPTADTRTVRACTLTALRSMAKGLMVTGLGTYAPAITSGAGHRFIQTGHQFRAPSTRTFAGACSINYVHAGDCGPITVAGEVRYSLNVTATALNSRVQDVAEPAHGGGWFARHDEEIASIGAVVLVAVPIAPGQLVAADGG